MTSKAEVRASTAPNRARAAAPQREGRMSVRKDPQTQFNFFVPSCGTLQPPRTSGSGYPRAHRLLGA